MAKWAANYSLATEITRPLINMVLYKFLQAMSAQLSYKTRFGFGSFEAEVMNLVILDLTDPGKPGDGVETDLRLEANFKLKIFGINIVKTNMIFQIDNVEMGFSVTPAGMPKGIVIRNNPKMKISVTFPKAKFIAGWILNKVIAPIVTFGIWMAFRLIRKLEIPVWELVDIFAVMGIRFASGSPLITAQNTVAPTSLLLGSDFNLTNSLLGDPKELKHFIPLNTNIGAVVHEHVLTASVEMAFVKGWVPTRFKVGKWKIYINGISVSFEKDIIRATGALKAKRGKCWCKVKARIKYDIALEPEITNTANVPKLEFKYSASVNTHISTKGMLVVLGMIMFAPIFMAMTVSFSCLINMVLDQFLPFSTTFSQSGNQITIQAQSLKSTGFIPLSMSFPLELSGQGSYELSRFQQFLLPGGIPADVNFTDDSLEVQEDELRVAVELT